MKIESMREKTVPELRESLLSLKRELFNTRVQRATGQTVVLSRFKRLRKEIARVYTLLAENMRAGKSS